MDYDLIVVKTLERVYKNYYYIIRGKFLWHPSFFACMEWRKSSRDSHAVLSAKQ